jgi:hypothetical protein
MENLLLFFQIDSNSSEGAGNEKVYFGHQVLIDEVLKLEEDPSTLRSFLSKIASRDEVCEIQ